MSQAVSSVLSIGLAPEAKGVSTDRPVESAFRQLREEYQTQQRLFESQPSSVQLFLQKQAVRMAEALVLRQGQIQFALPEQVVVQATIWSQGGTLRVPVEFREQKVAGLLGHLPVKDIRTAVRQRLAQLEQSNHPAVAVCARLVRYAMVKYMVSDMLPAGNPTAQPQAENDPMPTDLPVSATRQFYLPEWVAFDEERLLAGSVQEAEVRVASMQNYVRTLHLAVSLAPYIFADEDYQRKRYGMLAQLVIQGRALARYQTEDVIGRLGRFAQAGELNRGLSLSLPYFDDETLEMRLHDFEVIPAGRTLFVPAFVVLAARREQEKVAQNMRLSYSTRMHLLSNLKAFEHAFEPTEL